MIRQPGARYDLHLHSNRSDGRFEQGEVLERCAAAGLHVVALTDHDITAAIEPGLHRFGDRTLHLLAGAEVSGMHAGRELHLLVYFPGAVPDGFRAFCEEQVALRAHRYDVAIDNLGFALERAPTEAHGGDRAMTRLHLAHALVAAGHAQNVADAFVRFLGDRVGKVPAISLSFVEVIRVARRFGGVAAWAHPSVDDAQRFLPEFVAAGLQGIETVRPLVSSRDRKVLRNLARAHGLYVTGGSDWHGWHASEVLGLFSVHGHEIRGFLDALDAAA